VDAVESAGGDLLKDPHLKNHYDRLRAKGNSYARAWGGVMDRVLAIAVVCFGIKPCRIRRGECAARNVRKKTSF